MEWIMNYLWVGSLIWDQVNQSIKAKHAIDVRREAFLHLQKPLKETS